MSVLAASGNVLGIPRLVLEICSKAALALVLILLVFLIWLNLLENIHVHEPLTLGDIFRIALVCAVAITVTGAITISIVLS